MARSATDQPTSAVTSYTIVKPKVFGVLCCQLLRLAAPAQYRRR
jgi:hypothetical protein